MIKCFVCGFENLDNVKKCNGCGNRLSSNRIADDSNKLSALSKGFTLKSNFEIVAPIKCDGVINIYRAVYKKKRDVLIKERFSTVEQSDILNTSSAIDDITQEIPIPVSDDEDAERTEIVENIAQVIQSQKEKEETEEEDDVVSKSNAWYKEYDLLKKIRYPYFPKPITCFSENNRDYLVTDYIEGELLEDLIKKDYIIPFYDVLEWGVQICQALNKLHKTDYVYNNLKSDNIIISKSGKVVLTGFSKVQKVDKTNFQRVSDDNKSAIDYSVDISALGDIFYYIFASEQNPNASDEVKNISIFQAFPPEIDPRFIKIIFKAKNPNVNKRYLNAEEMKRDLLSLKITPTINIGKYSDLGMERENNEDGLMVVQTAYLVEGQKIVKALLGVADGMGGENAGEKASAIVIREISAFVQSKFLEASQKNEYVDLNDMLTQAVSKANRIVYYLSKTSENLKGMGTTLTLALLVDNQLYIKHVGDSRAYLINQDKIEQITKDHSKVQLLVDDGTITKEQARHHPIKNFIYRSLGDKSTVEIDSYQRILQPGDYLLLCTDGLWDYVEDDEIQSIVLSSKIPQHACHRLVNLANQRGGADNISVIVMKY